MKIKPADHDQCPTSLQVSCHPNGHKIYLCHYEAETDSYKTICIDKKAAFKHLDNHENDKCGECPQSASKTISLADGTEMLLLVDTFTPTQAKVILGDAGTVSLFPDQVTFKTLTGEIYFTVELPDLMVLTKENILLMTEFIAYQLASIPNSQAQRKRKLFEAQVGFGDSFPQVPCNKGCCEVYSRCLEDNNCDASSWTRLVCDSLLAVEKPVLPSTVFLGSLGTVVCDEQLLYSNCNCNRCDFLALSCIAAGCSGIEVMETSSCYDNKCNAIVQCPDASCDCLVPGEACQSPSSCGNGSCDYQEDPTICYTDCAYNRCPTPNEIECSGECVDPMSSNEACGACGIRCLHGRDCVLGRCSQPVLVSWELSSENIFVHGGWKVSNSGKTIRFEIEDSANCVEEGGNDYVQEGMAVATITVQEPLVSLRLSIVGIAELQDSGFEYMDIYLDDVLISTATSNNEDLLCVMGPSNVEDIVPSPIYLSQGSHQFRIEFTTGDSLYHVGAFYELNLNFVPSAVSLEVDECEMIDNWQYKFDVNVEPDNDSGSRLLVKLGGVDCTDVIVPPNWKIILDYGNMAQDFYCYFFVNDYFDALSFFTVWAVAIARDYLSSAQKQAIINTCENKESDLEKATCAGNEIYDVLFEDEKKVCKHYSMALKSVMKGLGIDAALKVRKTRGGAAHAWIESVIDGKDVILDCLNKLYVVIE